MTLLFLLLLAHRYPVEGVVVETIPGQRQMVVAHKPIENYMPAMTMPFRVGRDVDLARLTPGTRVKFELNVGKKASRPQLIRRLRAARSHHDRTGQGAPGNHHLGLKTLENASKMQRRLRYSEPAYYPRPVAEALGEVALKHGKKGTAEAAFRSALEDLPGSARSVNGLKDLQGSAGKLVGAEFSGRCRGSSGHVFRGTAMRDRLRKKS